ncbi:hypothetical protein D3C73_1410450 [compost metagenome]
MSIMAQFTVPVVESCAAEYHARKRGEEITYTHSMPIFADLTMLFVRTEDLLALQALTVSAKRKNLSASLLLLNGKAWMMT